MPEYEMKVRLSGDVLVTVEAESPEAARELAEESAEIGDVSSWTATADVSLPRDEDGFVITSAEFGEAFAVRVTYNTDPDGKWVDDDDYTNTTLHGTFDTEEEAVEWIDAYPDGDRDLKDIDVITINRVRPA